MVSRNLLGKKYKNKLRENGRIIFIFSLGEIITDGNGLLGTRRTVGLFNPLDSKCEGSVTDICCRLPLYKDIPLNEEIELPPPIPVECYDKLV